MKQPTTGIVFDIRRFSVNDGPGIRTTFFLQGCRLDCWWCHNPEGRPLSTDIDGLNELKKQHQAAVKASPALLRPEPWWFITAPEVVKEAERDRLFYDQSGGGVTFSGGEPFDQYKFLLEALEACHKAEIATAVDTSGFVAPKILEQAAQWASMFLFDVKIVDPARHLEFIGVPNAGILANIRRLNEMGKPVHMRIPIIPGYTDDEANIAALIQLGTELPCIRRVHLLPFHQLGEAKYKRMGIRNRLAGVKPPSAEFMNALLGRFEKAGLSTQIGG